MTESHGNILLVDDDRQTRLKLTHSLEARGHRVTSVSGGKAALETLGVESIDVILLDILMPEMDGYEATRRIRELDSDLAHIPIIALTAHSLQHEVHRAYEAGMNAHVTKPFQSEDLQHALEAIQLPTS